MHVMAQFTESSSKMVVFCQKMQKNTRHGSVWKWFLTKFAIFAVCATLCSSICVTRRFCIEVIDELENIPFTKKLWFFCRYNSTILAYGQTGSGKSFTMQEDPDHIGKQYARGFLTIRITERDRIIQECRESGISKTGIKRIRII